MRIQTLIILASFALFSGCESKKQACELYVRNRAKTQVDAKVSIGNFHFTGISIAPGKTSIGYGITSVPDKIQIRWNREGQEYSLDLPIVIPSHIDPNRFFAVSISISDDNQASIEVKQAQ